MGALIEIFIAGLSYFLVTFAVMPFLDSFAYTRKNVLLHGAFGAIAAYIHSLVGLNGLTINLFYLGVLYYTKKEGYKSMQTTHPEMNDVMGHMTVERANTFFYITFGVMYLLLNVSIYN